MAQSPKGIHYCLHCYGPLVDARKASTRCQVCGESSLRSDRVEYWTRERRFRRIELTTKASAILTAAVALGLVVWDAMDRQTFLVTLGPIGLVFAPLALLLVWDFSGLVTKRESLMHLERFLPLVILSVGLVPVFLGRALNLVLRSRGHSGLDELEVTPWFAIPFFPIAMVAHILLKSGIECRDRYVERRRATHTLMS